MVRVGWDLTRQQKGQNTDFSTEVEALYALIIVDLNFADGSDFMSATATHLSYGN